nr:MAG TPA: hypothetical protein [Caudoviricetes sp.]
MFNLIIWILIVVILVRLAKLIGKRAYGNMRSFLFFYSRIDCNDSTRNFLLVLWKKMSSE